MTRRLRVKLDFTLILDHDVTGIAEHWGEIPWALTLANALDHKKLGIEAVEHGPMHTLSVVDEKGRVRS